MYGPLFKSPEFVAWSVRDKLNIVSFCHSRVATWCNMWVYITPLRIMPHVSIHMAPIEELCHMLVYMHRTSGSICHMWVYSTRYQTERLLGGSDRERFRQQKNNISTIFWFNLVRFDGWEEEAHVQTKCVMCGDLYRSQLNPRYVLLLLLVLLLI